MTRLLLFLAEGPKNPAETNEKLLWAGGLMVAALLLGALIISLVDRWRKRQLGDSGREADSLTTYREMYSRGELSKEEYTQIRQKLSGQYVEPAKGAPSSGDDGSSEPSQDSPPPEP